MRSLPVIVGFGGANPAGRTSFHHAFLRLVYDALDQAEREKVIGSLRPMMGLGSELPWADAEAQVLAHTLVRTIEPEWFDVDRLHRHQAFVASAAGEPVRWLMAEADLPEAVPPEWSLERRASGQVLVTVATQTRLLASDYPRYDVRSAGQLPTGFSPGGKYPSKGHPRGLQLAIYGASDAVRSVGLEWQQLLAHVPADQVAVYASSAMGQLDYEGAGGMLQSGLLGKHTTSRNCPFGLPQMPADFVNAYVVRNVGHTAGIIGACATFLYNLEKAVNEIALGVVKVALVGTAEAPVNPEVVEGYRAMSALAEDIDLLELDGMTEGTPDHRKACRPFSQNCGFVMGESGQYVVLVADELALELGLTIHGSVPAVFVNADGAKKSISSPGIGNYLTLGKACGLAAKILGERGLRQHTLIQAHGTGTPQNRVTESHVFDRVAAAFDLRDWVVAATKCFVGHSLGAAAGDQLMFALGTMATGRVPGVVTTPRFADDIHAERLSLSTEHRQYAPNHWRATFVNSKGFGGNNATGIVLSTAVTEQLLRQRFGTDALTGHAHRNEAVREAQLRYESALLDGQDAPIYDFGTHVVDGDAVQVERHQIRLPGYELPITLEMDNPFGSVGD